MVEEGGGRGPWSLPADSSLETEPKPLQPKREKGLTVILEELEGEFLIQIFKIKTGTSVLDPDSMFFGPQGFGSDSQRYESGSESFHHQNP
jgi:hypothetical protein